MAKREKTGESRWESFREWIVQSTMSVLLVLGIAELLITEIKGLDEPGFGVLGRRFLPMLGIWTLSVVALSLLIYAFTFLLKRERANTSDLENRVVKAFIRGLESSSFNPRQTKKDADEQPAH